MEHRQLRTHDYTSNEGNEAVVIYTFNVNNEMERLLIEPSESMLEAVKETVPKQSYKVAHSENNSGSLLPMGLKHHTSRRPNPSS